jgi:predicted small metal-binding protein
MADNSKTNAINPQQRTFRCSDAGFKECKWQAVGHDDNEIMDQVREHGRSAHGITNFDDNLQRKVREHIYDRQAA